MWVLVLSCGPVPAPPAPCHTPGKAAGRARARAVANSDIPLSGIGPMSDPTRARRWFFVGHESDRTAIIVRVDNWSGLASYSRRITNLRRMKLPLALSSCMH